ncbi:MAG: sigma-54 dependent transcriptional regulator [Thermoguttaceae bacterium]|jgi:DNA-binding NtrC family response regulator|nr:sigma-54 dependent transcriptional regulator [Thermoguttaceae bacterium]
MDVLPSTICRPEAAGNALIVSRDSSLADDLQSILEKDYRCRLERAVSFSEAATFLDREVPEAIFVDLRKSSTREDPSGFLEQLTEWTRGRVPVVAISESGYVCDWAAIADLIVSGHLHLPLDRGQLTQLMEVELGRAMFEAPDCLRVPKVLRGRTVECRTYSPDMAEMLDDVAMMAAHDVTLLLVGETGTGKTTLAKLIHELSPRHEDNLLTLACGAIAPDLIETELFGHVKGAFTSAERSKIGKFEAARRGTLLLDEIDVLNPAQQVKLLRVIETGEFEPVGSNETRKFDARLIVASNVDLKDLMERNEFRADLYYRLNVMEFHLPALRNRPRDIVPLALGFVEELCQAHGVHIRRVHPEFLSCLKGYDWPGNIRELKNYVRRAVLFCRTGELTPKDLAPHMLAAIRRRDAASDENEDAPIIDRNSSLCDRVAASEKAMLEEALRKHNNNRTATAKTLGLSRVGLYKKMRKYGMIDRRN